MRVVRGVMENSNLLGDKELSTLREEPPYLSDSLCCMCGTSQRAIWSNAYCRDCFSNIFKQPYEKYRKITKEPNGKI